MPDPVPEDGPPLDAGTELVDFEGHLLPVVHPTYVSEEEYVRTAVQATQEAIQHGLKDPDGKRLERAEAYARWRYRGFQVGEVQSL